MRESPPIQGLVLLDTFFRVSRSWEEPQFLVRSAAYERLPCSSPPASFWKRWIISWPHMTRGDGATGTPAYTRRSPRLALLLHCPPASP
jgi:hypothetical protein